MATAQATPYPQGTAPQCRTITRVAPPNIIPVTAPQPVPLTSQAPPAPTTTHAVIHPASLAQREVDTSSIDLYALPYIFTLLDSIQGYTAQAHLKRLAAFPLSEHPPLVVCIEIPAPHIRMLWVQKFVAPLFAQPTPEDGNILAFLRDIHGGQIPASIEILAHWLKTQDITDTTAQELQAALLVAPQGNLLPTATPISNTFPRTKM